MNGVSVMTSAVCMYVRWFNYLLLVKTGHQLYYIMWNHDWSLKILVRCYRNGNWNSGGSCHLEKLPDLGPLPAPPGIHFKIVAHALLKHRNESQAMNLGLLNVTDLTSRRKDGHSSVYFLGPKRGPAPLHRQDCSHWCLPGVPDSWNELLYALFLKQETSHAQNSVEHPQAPL